MLGPHNKMWQKVGAGHSFHCGRVTSVQGDVPQMWPGVLPWQHVQHSLVAGDTGGLQFRTFVWYLQEVTSTAYFHGVLAERPQSCITAGLGDRAG